MSWKKNYILALLALFIATGPADNGFSKESDSKASGDDVAHSEELLHLVNQYRITQGLPSLVTDARLTSLARKQAEGMAKQGFISHDLPSGNISVRMSSAGYKHGIVRENVASARTVSYAHNALLESTEHKSNILAADVSHIGIGIAKGDPATRYGDYLFIVEIFASPR